MGLKDLRRHVVFEHVWTPLDIRQQYNSNKGSIYGVVCDRFNDSTLAYQGYGSRMPLADLRVLGSFATGGLVPDLTVLIDLPVEVGLRRKTGDEITRFEERHDVEFHGPSPGAGSWWTAARHPTRSPTGLQARCSIASGRPRRARAKVRSAGHSKPESRRVNRKALRCVSTYEGPGGRAHAAARAPGPD